MIRGFYSAKSGMIAQQYALDTISNNTANTNTAGFKPQLSAFASLLYENVNGGGGADISTGHGVKVQQNRLVFTQGELTATGLELNCGIDGDGFFTIENPENGDIYYTRDGSFFKSVEGEQIFLVDAGGNYVLGPDNNRIDITDGFEVDMLGIYSFENTYGLELIGNNYFMETAQSGAPIVDTESQVIAGMLESSTTDMGKEMIKMIETSRAFQFNSQIIQTADQMEQVINQWR